MKSPEDWRPVMDFDNEPLDDPDEYDNYNYD